MANKLYEESSVQAIATAIRGKNGSSDTYTISQMAPAIDALETGGGFYPSLLVSAATGSTVTATNGTDTVTLTEIESGKYWGEVTDYGEWTVTATNDGETADDAVSIELVEQYDMELAFIPDNPEDATWEQISALSQAGTAQNYWSIGDTKTIKLNGTIGTKSYSNVELKVFILHFNLPVNKTEADNNIIWGGFKNAAGDDVALDGAGYNSIVKSGEKYFNMNHWGGSGDPFNTNYGGWKGCDLRYDILGAVSTAPSGYGSTPTTSRSGSDATTAAISSPVANTLMAALPAEFRNILRLWTRHVDNKGNSSNVDANVTACVDAGISLLTEYEQQGTRSWANAYEQNHQTYLDYYKNGNPKIKKCQFNDPTAAIWWCASARYNSAAEFCGVYTNGGTHYAASGYCYALAPAFKT